MSHNQITLYRLLCECGRCGGQEKICHVTSSTVTRPMLTECENEAIRQRIEFNVQGILIQGWDGL